MAMAHEEETLTKKISLKTSDGDVYEVEEPIVMEFLTIKSFVDESNGGNSNNNAIPLPNVSTFELCKIVDYCKHHIDFSARGVSSCSEEAKSYDANFIRALSNEELKEMILAANYLNVKDLLDLLNQAVANLIQNKSVEFVRKFFEIESDFSNEEEEQLRRENAWAFEGVDED